MDKSHGEHVEAAEAGRALEVCRAMGEPPYLSPEHREYLLKRHGTLDLSPLPSMDDADPYNWAPWKVVQLKPSVANRAG
jgi:hypothetical protein